MTFGDRASYGSWPLCRMFRLFWESRPIVVVLLYKEDLTFA